MPKKRPALSSELFFRLEWVASAIREPERWPFVGTEQFRTVFARIITDTFRANDVRIIVK
ncbi:MAG: hypothetical protein K2X93_18090 [Candidatus Obscuribacterales bacterium]|nr:hypothetical protein [Candidatus Obscuribacterales bacterium]